MSSEQPAPPPPETTVYMLGLFADLYRQKIGAEEDVHRTLSFFRTALGIIIGALACAAGRLPKWSALTTHLGVIAFTGAALLLALAIIESACVLFFISRAISRRDCRRIGPETASRTRLSALQAFYDEHGMKGEPRTRSF
jgi:hypothetical protein